jgi:hypothetical protein
VAIGIELKTKTGSVRKEQKCMADQNMTAICRTLEQVLDVVLNYERIYGCPKQVERLEKFIERNPIGS